MEFNFAFYLSLVLAAGSCSGLLLAGRGKWYGWVIGLAVQPVWALYAIITEGYGLLITCVMFSVVNARGLYEWVKKNKTKRDIKKRFKELNGYHPQIMIIDEINSPEWLEWVAAQNLETFKKEMEKSQAIVRPVCKSCNKGEHALCSLSVDGRTCGCCGHVLV